MFEKFKSAGGQVVKERKPPEESTSKSRPQPNVRQSTVSRNEFDRTSSGRGGSGGGSGGRSGSGGSSSKSDSDSKIRSAAEIQAAYEKELSSFPNRFAIKLKCWFARVTPFGSKEVTPNAMSVFASDLKSALIEFKLAGNELLANQNYSPKIATALDKVNPTFIEVMAMTHKLYNESELHELTAPYNASPNTPVPLERIRDPLYGLFKKLYILYPYQEAFRKGIHLAYEHLQKLEGKPALIYTNRRKKILSETENLFGTIFEKLYLLIIRSEDKNIPMISRYMETVLGIQPEDKPGTRKAGEGVSTDPSDTGKDGGQSEEQKESQEEKKEEDTASKEMVYGRKLMQMYPIEKLRKKFDPRGEYSNIPDSDKALLTLLYFKEFDDNYSFVMTTKKIDIKQVHVNGARVDYRQKLLDQYETARSILDHFRIYADTYKEYSEHLANPGANYIEASKKTTALEKKRAAHSRNVRMTTKEFMEKTRDLIGVLVQDIKSKNEIVGNKNDLFQFDSVEARKRLNKQPISRCIIETFCYTMALADLLDTGLLFGGVLDLSPEEMSKWLGTEIVDPKKEQDEKVKQIEDSLGNPPEMIESGSGSDLTSEKKPVRKDSSTEQGSGNPGNPPQGGSNTPSNIESLDSDTLNVNL